MGSDMSVHHIQHSTRPCRPSASAPRSSADACVPIFGAFHNGQCSFWVLGFGHIRSPKRSRGRCTGGGDSSRNLNMFCDLWPVPQWTLCWFGQDRIAFVAVARRQPWTPNNLSLVCVLSYRGPLSVGTHHCWPGAAYKPGCFKDALILLSGWNNLGLVKVTLTSNTVMRRTNCLPTI